MAVNDVPPVVMTQQNTQLIAQVLSIAGMFATTLGWLTPTQVVGITTNVLAAIGPLATLGGIVWSLLASRKKSIVAEVAALPEVKAVQLENTAAGRELEAATPSNVSVNHAMPAVRP
jgi:hypothetical protein